MKGNGDKGLVGKGKRGSGGKGFVRRVEGKGGGGAGEFGEGVKECEQDVKWCVEVEI